MKNVGLLIVNYNDSANTIKLINNVDNYKVINKIVVVDNKSTDNSLEELKKLESEKIHIINNKENKGYANAINVGSKYLNKELDNCIIIVSNSDIEINNEEIILKLINDFKDNIKCVMPKVKENNTYKYGWKLTSSGLDLLINIPVLSRLYKDKIRYYKDDYFKTDTSIVDVIYGCFFLIDGDYLKKIGYLDDNTFLYYEEYILARKNKITNTLSLCDNTVYVEHKHNATIGTNVSKINKYKIYKKSQLYYEKNYNNAGIIHMGIFKLFYYIGLLILKIKLLFK